MEFRTVHSDGTIKYIHGVGHPVFGATGEVVEYVGTAVDVTGRKRSEEALRQSERNLAEAQRLTHTGSFIWDVRTKQALYLSDEWYRVYGFDIEAEQAAAAGNGELERAVPRMLIEGHAWEERLQRIHPEDRPMWQAEVDRAIQQKSDYDFDFRILLPNGATKYLHTIGHPVVNHAGNVVQFTGSVTDITERKRAERALRDSEELKRRIIESSTDCIKVLDLEGNLLFMSSGGQQLLEIDDIQPYLNTCWIDFWQPEDRPRVIESIATARAGGIGTFQAFCPSAKGIPRWWDVITTPICNADGQPEQLLSVSRDVTERKRAEAELERMHQMEADLAHINRVSTLGELAASLAHELNQPIAAAITNANTCLRWLRREQPDIEEAVEAAMRIVKDGTRASDIINRLRSFYKQGMPPERELIDVNDVAREILVLLRGEATRYSISIRTELDGNAPPVTADRVQLQQVFMNLILNGIEAMKDTAGELTIKSQRTDDNRLLVSISDTGIGLPAEKADQIFNAFFTTKPQGTGMGLAITRSIIESHGGRLWATPNSGRGVTFSFTLPAEMAARA